MSPLPITLRVLRLTPQDDTASSPACALPARFARNDTAALRRLTLPVARLEVEPHDAMRRRRLEAHDQLELAITLRVHRDANLVVACAEQSLERELAGAVVDRVHPLDALLDRAIGARDRLLLEERRERLPGAL